MKEILKLLPVLFVAASMNIGAGVYYNVGTKNLNFNRNTFISGIIKTAIVGGFLYGQPTALRQRIYLRLAPHLTLS